MSSVEIISINSIIPNENDTRSLDARPLAVLAESIKASGILQPLAVYDNDNGTFTLLSGRRRYEASMRTGLSELPCEILDKPSSLAQEIEIMAQANMHRSDPEDLKFECLTMDRNWNSMPEEQKKAIKEVLKAEFIRNNEDNPRYIENPSEFTRRNFRPRLDYIRLNTGLDLANSTVCNYLKELNHDSDAVTTSEINESVVEDTSSSSSSSIPTIKKIRNATKKLRNMLDEVIPESPEQYEALMKLASCIDDITPFLADND